MSFLSKISGMSFADSLKEVGKAVDELTTSKEEIQQKLNELSNQSKEIIISETAGNWLQRSWRPITMLVFVFIVTYAYFIQPAFLPDSVPIRKELPGEFWQLLTYGLSGYLVGRTAEKIVDKFKKK